MCVFVYRLDNSTEPAVDRAPMKFTGVFLGYLSVLALESSTQIPRATASYNHS